MKIVVSSIGSRGDIQPIMALGVALQTRGHTVTLCVPPNFQSWVESRGLTCVPLGQDLRKWTADSGAGVQTTQSRAERRKQIMAGLKDTIREHFSVTKRAAKGCDLIIVANGIQSAGGSIAELYDLPYVFVTYCPATLRSDKHPPPSVRWQNMPRLVNRVLWALGENMWNKAYREAVNAEREALGLPAAQNVVDLIVTREPWVAADPALAPYVASTYQNITQTGAWLLPDRTPLPEELELFLAAGEPPVYLGFGSMWASAETGVTLLQAVRKLGRRVVISKGWANLDPSDAGKDCIVVDDVAHAQLFPRVAAVVHHGGAGTTTAAALAGVPQVLIPHVYDQHYWAHRVHALGIGVAGPRIADMTTSGLVEALSCCLQSSCTARAKQFSDRMEWEGAQRAAERITSGYEFSRR